MVSHVINFATKYEDPTPIRSWVTSYNGSHWLALDMRTRPLRMRRITWPVSRGSKQLHHGLRGSASPVLTATGFVNGRWQFSTPPQNKHPLSDHQKIWYRWLRRRPLLLRQIWWKSVDGGLLGKWVKYNEFFYLYPFSMNSPTGQTRRRIFTLDVSNDADLRKDVPFGGILWQPLNRHISATVWPILMKFGTVTHICLLQRIYR